MISFLIGDAAMDQIYQFLAFALGLFIWMLNKADDRTKGIDPLVPKWHNYFAVYWIPLMSRFMIDTAFYWMLFDQQLVSKGFDLLGWTGWSWAVSMITMFKPVAFLFGFFFDSLLEKFLITKWADKIPLVNVIPIVPPPHHIDVDPQGK